MNQMTEKNINNYKNKEKIAPTTIKILKNKNNNNNNNNNNNEHNVNQ